MQKSSFRPQQYKTSVSNIDRCERNDCYMTQTVEKLHMEIPKLVKNLFLNGVNCQELKFQSPSLETAITTELPTKDELQKSIVVAPGEGKSYTSSK